MSPFAPAFRTHIPEIALARNWGPRISDWVPHISRVARPLMRWLWLRAIRYWRTIRTKWAGLLHYAAGLKCWHA